MFLRVGEGTSSPLSCVGQLDLSLRRDTWFSVCPAGGGIVCGSRIRASGRCSRRMRCIYHLQNPHIFPLMAVNASPLTLHCTARLRSAGSRSGDTIATCPKPSILFFFDGLQRPWRTWGTRALQRSPRYGGRTEPCDRPPAA